VLFHLKNQVFTHPFKAFPQTDGQIGARGFSVLGGEKNEKVSFPQAIFLVMFTLL
jgi:hypothetical protein